MPLIQDEDVGDEREEGKSNLIYSEHWRRDRGGSKECMRLDVGRTSFPSNQWNTLSSVSIVDLRHGTNGLSVGVYLLDGRNAFPSPNFPATPAMAETAKPSQLPTKCGTTSSRQEND